MSEIPDAAAIVTYLARNGMVVDEETVEPVLQAEAALQAAACRVDPYEAPLAEALRRRVLRSFAMQSVPLGIQVGEFGSTRIGSIDPEVRRLEAPYRRLVCG